MGKYVHIILLKYELFSFKTRIVEKDVQLASLNEFFSLVEEKEQQKRALSDQEASDFQWLMKEGISSFLRAVTNSADFGDVNAALQTVVIQLGLRHSCLEMKEMYVEALDSKNVHYSYPDAQHHVLYHFSYMITHNYSLFNLLKREKFHVDTLKKELAGLDLILKWDGASSST